MDVHRKYLREDRDMNKRTRVMVMAVLIVLVAWTAHAGKEVAFDETFDVESGWKLEVEVDDMDVEVKPGGANEARVVVTLTGDVEKARERFEESRFEVERDGETLVVETQRRRRWSWSWSWSSSSRTRIHVSVMVPEKFDVYAHTSDGDVVVTGVEGEVEVKTSDGEVELGDLKGPSIYAKSSDGDITADELNGKDINLRTSDGDISAERIESDRVSLHTSDGNVRVEKIEAESISARTSDGDLELSVTGKELKARSSDGDIEVTIEGNMALDLSTSDGDITIRAPSGLGADLDLKGEYVKLGGKVTIEGDVSKRRITGILGDGGPKVRARTSDGKVSLRFY
jgi:DUF4097 and DUF4098 domain-containing protein YvlB